MFKNQKKIKKFPEGTFIPKQARILSILQLCIAFTLIFWILGKPIIEDTFILKKYTHILDTLKNSNEYSKLPEFKKEEIHKNFIKIKEITQSSFEINVKKIFNHLTNISPYKLLWVLFSIMISIFLLKKNSHSKILIWLLPFLATVYLIDNLIFGQQQSITYEENLFPTESFLINNYLKNPLSKNILSQKEELEKGFQLFLQDKWEDNSYNVSSNYAFNLARLDAYNKDILTVKNTYLREQMYILLSYIIWNFFYSFVCYKHAKILY